MFWMFGQAWMPKTIHMLSYHMYRSILRQLDHFLVRVPAFSGGLRSLKSRAISPENEGTLTKMAKNPAYGRDRCPSWAIRQYENDRTYMVVVYVQPTIKHSPIPLFPLCHIGKRLQIWPPVYGEICKRLHITDIIRKKTCKRLQVGRILGGKISKRAPIWHGGNRAIGECLVVDWAYATQDNLRIYEDNPWGPGPGKPVMYAVDRQSRSGMPWTGKADQECPGLAKPIRYAQDWRSRS